MVSIRTALWAVNVLLVAGLTYASSVLAAAWLERELVENTAAPSRQQSSSFSKEKKRSALPFSEFQAILDVNMFRARRSGPKEAPVTAPAAGEQPSAPTGPSKTLPIKLALTGTFIADTTSIAFVIGPDGRTERTYQTKECLPRDDNTPVFDCQPTQGKLAKIESDRIVVTMNGGRYIVKLGEGNLPKSRAATNVKKNTAGKRRQSVKPGSRRRLKSGLGKKKGAFPSTRTGNNIEMTVPSAEVEKAFENFAGIVNQARVVPYMVDGEPRGFQIRKIAPGSIFERLGLNNSDIIESVNGESLTTADQALRLFSLFRNESEVVLEIRRNNQPVQLTYTIE